jgi:hemerythrin superfamily protein
MMIERKRNPDSHALHDREAGRIDSGQVVQVAPAKILPRLKHDTPGSYGRLGVRPTPKRPRGTYSRCRLTPQNLDIEGNHMATNSTRSADGKRRNDETDAIALLTADHKTVKSLFKEFEKLTKQDNVDEEKAQLVRRICNELTVHAQIEEEIFYPAVREAIDDDDLMDEADVEHASAKDLIAQLETLEPGDDHYDARVTVLGEYVDHHVKEEEGEMFGKVRKADLETAELGSKLAERKQELMAELGVDEEDEEDATTMLQATKRESRKPSEKRK